MDIELGGVLPGKVTSITKFGAFVSVSPGKSGLVHISEIANSYVSDVSQHLAVGQEVQVKVIGLENGKINLSIKAALPPSPPRAPRPAMSAAVKAAPAPAREPSFEDKLSRFMKDSETRMSGTRGFEKKPARRRGK